MAKEPHANRMMMITALVLCTLLAGSAAGPWQSRSDTQCAIECKGNTKFFYDVEKIYTYNYVAKTSTGLRTGMDAGTWLTMRATVDILPTSPCDFSMTLRDVVLENPESSDVGGGRFGQALQRRPLRFAFQDGRIDDLCADQDEDTWVLNIKRGILSTFQNTMNNLQEEQSLEEVDVTGRCRTHYKLSSDSLIQKTKSLADCSDRSDYVTAILSSSLAEKSGLGPSGPLMQSTHQCQQKIDAGILKQTVCKEEHKFQPFSREESGATTTNTQTLTFLSKDDRAMESKGPGHRSTRHTTLLFDHGRQENSENTDAIDEAEESLQELCKVAQDDVRPEVARLFAKVVHSMQKLDSEDLIAIYKKINKICSDQPKGSKFFLDAIPLLGTEASIAVMKDMILENLVSKEEVDMWFTMLGFTPKPSKNMIASLLPLLAKDSQHPKALLGISALIHVYCKGNDGCDREPEVQRFVEIAMRNLGSNCATDNGKKEQVIVTLKALGNVGYIGRMTLLLKECYRTMENPIDVRLAAIDAFRRLPCAHRRDDLLQIFFDINEESEVRIGSFLAAMKCPTKMVLDQIYESLDHEPVNQVGSFVWTYLTNHQESSDVQKRNIQKIISDRKLNEKFSTDSRKFSRYYEGGLYVDSLRTGIHTDGTLVFSSKSYLPRSASVGLKLELFGETVDLFEVGGRAEGFEGLVESFFGPKGYFPDDTIQKMLTSAREQDAYSRTKLNNIAKVFNFKNAPDNDDPRGALYMRVFGNDFDYVQFQGLEQLMQSTGSFNIFDVFLKLAQSQEVKYVKNNMLVDSSLTIPTSTGLPLKLVVNGTATVNFQIGGKIDLDRLTQKSLDIQARLAPSASVEISGSMMTDAFVTCSGLRLVGTLHTSTYADAEVSVSNGQVIKAQFNVPKKQMEIINIQSKVVVVNGADEQEHAPLVDGAVDFKKCTSDTMSRITGLRLCGQLRYPQGTSTWPLAGPFVARLDLHKTDAGLQSYNFEYRWDKQTVTAESGQIQSIRTGRLSFDTPGSTVERELTAEFVYNEQQKSVDLRLVSPLKKISANGRLTSEQPGLSMKWTMDGAEFLALQLGVVIDRSGVESDYRLEPSFQIQYRGRPVAVIKGFLVRQTSKKYAAELTIEHLTVRPIVISGGQEVSVHDGSARYDADFRVNAGELKTFAKMFVQKDRESNVAMKSTFEYSRDNGPKQSLSLSAKARRGAGDVLNANAEFQCTLHPSYNWAVNVDGKHNMKEMDVSLTAVFGDKSDDTTFRRLTIQHKHSFQGELPRHKLIAISSVSFPPADIDFSANVRSELTATNSLDTSLSVKYAGRKQVSLTVSCNKGRDAELLTGHVKLNLPSGRTMKANGALALRGDTYTATAVGSWTDDQDARAVIILTKRTSPNDFSPEVRVELSLPGQSPLILQGNVLLNDEHKKVAGEVELNGECFKTHAEYQRPSTKNVQVSGSFTLPRGTYAARVALNADERYEKRLRADLHLADLRHLSSQLRLRRSDDRVLASAELNTDTDGNNLRKYAIRLDYTSPATITEGQLVFECPHGEVGARWNASTQRLPSQLFHRGTYDVWWSPDERIAVTVDAHRVVEERSRGFGADVHVHTPFRGLEEISLTSRHADDGKNWKNDVALSLLGTSVARTHSEGKVIIAENGAMHLKATVQLETPFPQLPTLVVRLDHQSARRHIDSNVQLTWSPKQNVVIRARGSIEGDSLVGVVHVRTPFAAVENVSVSGNFLRDGSMTKVKTDWNGNAVDIRLQTGGHVKSGDVDVHAAVHVATSLEWWQNVDASVNFACDREKVQLALNGTLNNRDTVAIELGGSYRSNVDAEHATLLIRASGPLRFWDNVELRLRHERSTAVPASLHQLASLVYNGRVASAELQWTDGTELKAEVIEPFETFQRAKVNLKYVLGRGDLRIKAEATMKDKTAAVQMNFLQKDNVLQGSATADLPFLPVLQAEFEHQQQGTSYDTMVKGRVDQKEATIRHILNFKSVLDFDSELRLDLPLDSFPGATLKSLQRLDDRGSFQHKSVVAVTGGANRSLSVVCDKNEAVVQLETPWWRTSLEGTRDVASGLHQLRLRLPQNREYSLTTRHRFGRNTGYVNATLTIPEKQLALAADYDLSSKEKSGHLEARWDDAGAVEVSLVHQMSGSFCSNALFLRTPFDGFEYNALEVQWDASPLFTAAVSANFRQKNYNLAVQKKSEPGQEYYEATLSSPFEGLRKAKLSCRYEHLPSDRSVYIMAENEAGRMELTVFHSKHQASMDSGVIFTSPFQSVERLVAALHCDSVDGDERKARLSLQKNDVKTEATIQYNIGPDSGHLTVEFSSPIVGLENLGVYGRYHVNSLSLNATRNGEHIEFDARLEGSAKKRRVTISLQDMRFLGEYDLRDLPLTALLSIDRGVYEHADLAFSMDTRPGNVQFAVVVSSTVEGMRRAKIAGNLTNERRHFLIESEDKKIELELKHRIQPWHTTLVLDTSFDGYKHSEVSFEYDDDVATRKATVHIRKDDDVRLDGEAYLGVTGSSLAANIINFPGVEKMSAQMSVDWNGNKKVHKVIATKGSQTYSAKWEVDHATSHHESNLKLDIPDYDALFHARYNLEDANEATFEAKTIVNQKMAEVGGRFLHDVGFTKVDSSLSFKTNVMTQGHSDGTVEWKLSRSDDRLHTTVTGITNMLLPFVKTFSASVDWNRPEETVTVTLSKDDDKVEASGRLIIREDSVKGTLAASSSFEGYKSLVCEWSAMSATGHQIVTASVGANDKNVVDVMMSSKMTEKTSELELTLLSAFDGLDETHLSLTLDRATTTPKAKISASVSEKTAEVGIKGFAGQDRGDFVFLWKNNFVPSYEDGSIRLKYDVDAINFDGKVIVRDRTIYSLELGMPDDESVALTLDSPVTNRLTLNGQFQVTDHEFHVGCTLNMESASLLQASINLSLAISDEAREQRLRFTLKSNLTSHIHALEGDFNVQKNLSKMTTVMKWNDEQEVKLAYQLVSNGLTITFTSPLEGYKRVHFAVQKTDKNPQKASVLLLMQDKRMELTLSRKPGAISMCLVSPFDEQSLDVDLRYGNEPLRAALVVLLSPNQKFNLSALADLQRDKSRWHLSVTTPIVGHQPYAISGYHDFVHQQPKAGVVIEGFGEKIEALAYIVDDQATNTIHFSLTTPFDVLSQLSATRISKLWRNNISLEVKGMTFGNELYFGATGAIENGQVSSEVNFRSPFTKPVRVTVQGQTSLNSVEYTVDINEQLVVLKASIKRDFDHRTYEANIQSSSNVYSFPSFVVASRSGLTSNGSFTTHNIRWREAEVYRMDLRSSYNVDNGTAIAFDGKLGPAAATVQIRRRAYNYNLLVKASSDPSSEVTLNVLLQNDLPLSLEAKASITTPFHGLSELASTLTLSTDYPGSQTDAVANLKTPFSFLPHLNVVFHSERKSTALDGTIRAEIGDSTFAAHGFLDPVFFVSGILRGSLTIETPYDSFKLNTISINARPVSGENSGQLQLQFTTSDWKTTLEGTAMLQPGNYDVKTRLQSNWMVLSPVDVRGKLSVNDERQKELQLSISSSKTDHGIRLTHRSDDGRLVGEASVVSKITDFDDHLWKAHYTLGSSTLATNATYQRDKEVVSSFELTLQKEHNFFTVDAVATSDTKQQHTVSASYALQSGNSIFKADTIIKSHLLPSKSLLVNLRLNKEDLSLLVSVGEMRNVISAEYKAMSPNTYVAQMTVDLPSLSMAKALLSGKCQLDKSGAANGELILDHPSCKASGQFRLVPGELTADFKLSHRNVDINVKTSHRGTTNYRQMSGTTTIATNWKTLTVDSKWDVDGRSAQLDLSTDEGKVLGVAATFHRDHDDQLETRLSVTYNKMTHDAEFKWRKTSSEHDIELQMSLPLVDARPFHLRSRLVAGRSFDSALNLADTHSFSVKWHRDVDSRQLQAMANTPLFVYILKGKLWQGVGQISATISLTGSNDSHSFQFDATENESGVQVYQAQVDTPIFDLGKCMFTIETGDLHKEEFDVNATLVTKHATHRLEVRQATLQRQIDGRVAVKSPAFDVGSVTCDYHLEVIDKRTAKVKLDFVRNQDTYAVDGKIGMTANGFLGRFNVSTPFTERFEVQGKLEQMSRRVDFEGTLKTPNDEHKIMAKAEKDDGLVSCHFTVNTPLLACQNLTAIGRFHHKEATAALGGDVVIETLGKKFQLQTDYHRKDAHSSEARFSLKTPLRSLQFLEVKGRVNRDTNDTSSLNGTLEMTMSNNEHQEFKLRFAYQNVLGELTSASVEVRTPMTGYEHLEADYRNGAEDDGRRMTMTMNKNGRVYGWDSHVVHTSGIRSAKLNVTWDNQNSSVRAGFFKLDGGRSMALVVGTPFRGLENLELGMRYHYHNNKYAFATALAAGRSAVFASGDLDVTDPLNIKGNVQVKSTIAGYENMTTRYQQTNDGKGKFQMTVEQIIQDKPLFRLSVSNVHGRGSGQGQLQLTALPKSFGDIDAYYEYDVQADSAIGNARLSYDGKQMLQIDASSRSGTRMLEIANPIRPIFVRYAYVVDGDTLSIGCEFGSTEKRHDDIVGFNATITTTATGKTVNIRTIHPVRPLTVTFQCDRREGIMSHSAQLMWDTSNAGISYSFSLTKQSEESQDMVVRLVLPFRTFELSADRRKGKSSCEASAMLRWDAKKIGFRYRLNDLSDVDKLFHQIELSVYHPLLEKDLTLRSELSIHRTQGKIFSNRLELEYSRAENAKLTFETHVVASDDGYSFQQRLRHPVTDTDVELSAATKSNGKGILSAEVQLSYLSMPLKQSKTIRLQGSINVPDKQLQLVVTSPSSKVELDGQLMAIDQGYRVLVQSKINDNDGYSIDMQVDRQDGHMAQMRVLYDPDKKSTMMMRSGMPNNRTITLHLFREQDGVTIDDVRFLVQLNRSRELVTKFHWQPSTVQNLQTTVASLVHSLCTAAHHTSSELSVAFHEETKRHYDRFLESLEKATSPMVLDLARDIEAFSRDSKDMQDFLKKLYADNSFFVRDILGATSQVLRPVRALACNAVSLMKHTGRSVVSVVADVTSNINDLCDYICTELPRAIGGYANDVPYAIWHQMSRLSEFSHQKWSQMTLTVLRFLKDVVVYTARATSEWKVTTPPWIHQLSRDASVKLEAYLEQFTKSTYYMQLKSGTGELRRTAMEIYNHKFWARMWTTFSSRIQNVANNVVVNRHTQQILRLGSNVYDVGVWIYKFLNVENLAKEALNAAIIRLEDVALQMVQETVFPELYFPNIQQDVVFDPENGKVEIVQKLPVPWHSFNEMPHLIGSPEYDNLVQFKNGLHSLPKTTLKNLRNAWNSEFRWNNILLPTRGRALLAGNQHYVTFDGHAYEFAGECTYLLAKDFADGNFTAIVEYKRDENGVLERSIHLELDGHIIEIVSDRSMRIDGAETELPTTVDSVKLTSTGKILSVESEARQVWFRCDVVHHVCLMEIGGFYHGKTGGLFGSFDHEPFNDLAMPSRIRTSGVEEFARSWEIGARQCRSHEDRAVVDTTDSYQTRKPCEELFGRFNTLGSCMKKVNPDSYKTMCINDIAGGSGICGAATAYIMMCQANGVSVELPNACLQCEVNGQVLRKGEETVVEKTGIEQSVDTVFIVDNTWQCSTTFPNLRSTVATIARHFEGAFHDRSLRNNRYAVVGFGDSTAPRHPEVIPIAGQTFGSVSSLHLAIDNIHFAAGHHHHLSELIEYATKLPFRATVKKVFVLVPCADEANEPAVEAVTYQRLTTTLSDMDAVLHTISIREPVIRDASGVPSANILGYDSKVAYTTSSLKKGSPSVRRHIEASDSMSTALTFHTKGSVFLASRLASAQPKISQVANDAFARRVVLEATPAACQTCMCQTTDDDDNTPVVTCSRCTTEDHTEKSSIKKDLTDAHFAKMKSNKVKRT